MWSNCRRRVKTLPGMEDSWIRESGLVVWHVHARYLSKWEHSNMDPQAVIFRASQNSVISWPGPTQGPCPLLWKRIQGIKKNTSLRFSMGLALKLRQLVEHRNEAFSTGRRDKGRFLEWGSLVPCTEVRKRWFARRGQHTPCIESLRDILINLWVPPRLPREHRLLVSSLKQEEKEACLPFVHGKAHHWVSPGTEERTEFTETVFSGICGRY